MGLDAAVHQLVILIIPAQVQSQIQPRHIYMSHGNQSHRLAEIPAQVMPANTSTVDCTLTNNNQGIPSKPKFEKLRGDNWFAWKTRISIVLRRYGVFGVATGSIKKPEDSEGAAIWNSQDLIAQELITTSIKDEQVIHISECETSAEMWSKLWAVHEGLRLSHKVSTQKKLYAAQASEGTDIAEHIKEMKRLRNRLSLAGYRIEESMFKEILVSSLPRSWDGFTASFSGYQWGGKANEYAIGYSVQELVSILCEEYYRRRKEKNNVSEIAYPSKRGPKACKICGKVRHTEDDCWHNPKNKGKGRTNKNGR